MERFIRKLFGLTFSALLAVVMLFSSVTVFYSGSVVKTKI